MKNQSGHISKSTKTNWKIISDIVERKKIAHLHYEAAWRELLSHISFANPGDIILLVGMTGAGKSKIATGMNSLLRQETPEGKVASVYGLASNSGYKGKFDNKEMIKNLLRSFGHPAFTIESSLSVADMLETRTRQFTSSQVARLLYIYVHNLGAKFIFLDEAQHLGYTGSSRSTIDSVLNYWKAFAEEAGIVLVLVASYKLLEIIGESGHLIRRSRLVHLNRYRNDSDIEEFVRILSTYSKFLPGLEDIHSNYQWIEGIRSGCHGSIGLLTKWIGRGISYCHAHDLNFLTPSIIDYHQFNPRELETIEREIAIGDRYFFSKKPTYFSTKLEKIENTKEVSSKNSTKKPFQQKPKKHSTKSSPGKRGIK